MKLLYTALQFIVECKIETFSVTESIIFNFIRRKRQQESKKKQQQTDRRTGRQLWRLSERSQQQ